MKILTECYAMQNLALVRQESVYLHMYILFTHGIGS